MQAASKKPPAPPANGSDACLVVLCGLPGAGKSTLCRTLRDSMDVLFEAPSPKIWHVCFDDVENSLAASSQAESFSAEVWQKSRKKAHEAVERLLSKNCAAGSGNRHLILVDDNMYYRSMRHSMFQLARQCTYSPRIITN